MEKLIYRQLNYTIIHIIQIMLGIKKQLLNNANREIINLIKSIPGNKTLIIDGTLNKLINISLNHNIQSTKKLGISQIYFLTSIIDPTTDTIIYIIRDNQIHVNIINNQLSKYPNHKYHIYIVPRFPQSTQHQFDKCICGELKYISLLPIDKGIFSMELPIEQSTHAMINNPIMIHNIAHSLTSLGYIPEICGSGIHSNKIANFLKQNNDPKNDLLFDKLILVDRQCDLFSLLSIPTSYEGITEELLPEMNFDTKDNIYNEIKHMSLQEASTFLNTMLKQIKSLQGDKDLDKIKLLVETIKKYPKQNIAFHINIIQQLVDLYDKQLADIEDKIKNGHDMTNEINDYVENIITYTIDHFKNYTDKQKLMSIAKILKLLCFASIHNHGIDFEEYKTTIIQTYGYKYLHSFEKLKEYGLIKSQKLFNWKKSNVPILMDIINDINNHSNNKDYFYFGNKIKNKTNKIMVFIVGGITYDEIFHMKLEKWNTDNKIYIGSTNITSGSKIIKSFV